VRRTKSSACDPGSSRGPAWICAHHILVPFGHLRARARAVFSLPRWFWSAASIRRYKVSFARSAEGVERGRGGISGSAGRGWAREAPWLRLPRRLFPAKVRCPRRSPRAAGERTRRPRAGGRGGRALGPVQTPGTWGPLQGHLAGASAAGQAGAARGRREGGSGARCCSDRSIPAPA
jgi:hypothetical protein